MSIFRVDGRICGEDKWVAGATKFTNIHRAGQWKDQLVKAFREHGRWPMEFRVALVEGDLLDSLNEVPDCVAAAMDSEPGELPDAVAAAWASD